jgi:hypothetical protein
MAISPNSLVDNAGIIKQFSLVTILMNVINGQGKRRWRDLAQKEFLSPVRQAESGLPGQSVSIAKAVG